MLTEIDPNLEEVIDSITAHIPRVINSEQIETLMREITFLEVEEVVKEIPRNKAWGLDGFTTNLFKDF